MERIETFLKHLKEFQVENGTDVKNILHNRREGRRKTLPYSRNLSRHVWGMLITLQTHMHIHTVVGEITD